MNNKMDYNEIQSIAEGRRCARLFPVTAAPKASVFLVFRVGRDGPGGRVRAAGTPGLYGKAGRRRAVARRRLPIVKRNGRTKGDGVLHRRGFWHERRVGRIRGYAVSQLSEACDIARPSQQVALGLVAKLAF